MDRITFPDPEAVVVTYLNGTLTARGDVARAQTRVPEARPPRMVRVIWTGANRTAVSRRDAQVTVECWDAAGAPQASELAGDVYADLCALDVGASHVPQGPDGWLGGPYSQPDPVTGTPRYVMTVILRQRAI